MATTVEKSNNFLHKTFGKVSDGGVKINELQWLVHHRDKFCGAIHTVLNDGGRANLALQLREKDLQAYQDINTNVNCALQMCRQYIQTGMSYSSLVASTNHVSYLYSHHNTLSFTVTHEI